MASAPLLRWLALALVALAALWLRTHDLAARPMHADEANQAVKTGRLLEHGTYAFDPHDHHGPTLYYAALPVAWLRGQTTLAALDETTVRLVPALAGTFAVVLLFALVRPVGFWTALAAAAFLGLAPPAVYYSRYFVQETLLLACALALGLALRHWWLTGRRAWAVAAGVAVGLMQATKASAPLLLLAVALAVLALRPPRPATSRLRADLLAALAAALAVAALFYSSFGTHLAGLRDAVLTYFPAAARATGASGHEKPWTYWLTLLTAQRSGGLSFSLLALTLPALLGTALTLHAALRPARSRPSLALAPARVGRGALVATAVLGLTLTLTPYKTPWHLIHLLPGLAVLAAVGLTALPRPWIAGPLIVVVLVFLGHQTRLAVFQRPADARNPYAYVHSSPDVRKVRTLAAAALLRAPTGAIRIIGEEYWPLPWYLRGLPQVGYWPVAPADCDGALIVSTASQADAVRARLRGAYRESYVGLRPGLLCVVFTPRP